MIYRDEIKEHLKKLKQIKRDLKKPGTPLRKQDRIDVKHSTQTRTNGHPLPNGNNKRSSCKSSSKNLDEHIDLP